MNSTHIMWWRQALLTLGLWLLYLLVVTPAAWLMRLRGITLLALAREPESPSYWIAAAIDSSNRNTYHEVAGSSARSRVTELLRDYSAVAVATCLPVKRMVLRTLLGLRHVAPTLQESKLQTDLYVMF